ncbi:MAG: thiamine-phosphate kinase [Pseudomonadota bacterium]
MGEFSLIDAFFKDICPRAAALNHPQAFGIGDDAALLSPVPPDQQLVVTTDTLVEGRHYWPEVDPQALGHKVLAVNLSDLAAMGARPWAFTLSVSLRAPRVDWLSSFSSGMATLARRAGIALVGGDTVGLGPDPAARESFTVTAMGLVPLGQALRRDGLQPGDRLWVSGTLGDGQAAVAQRLSAEKLLWPEPRLALGEALRGLAHAAIDISDGLSSELGHLVRLSRARCESLSPGASSQASGFSELYLEVSLGALAGCLGPLLREAVGQSRLDLREACRQAAASGDEYELLFAAPDAARSEIIALGQRLEIAVTEIGRVCASATQSPPVVWVDDRGQPLESAWIPSAGFDHFPQET